MPVVWYTGPFYSTQSGLRLASNLVVSSMHSETTIEEAQKYILERVDDGVTCPCCRQHAQRYRRTITSATARTLILVERRCRADPLSWLHVPTYLGSVVTGFANPGNGWSSLRLWGLIEAMPDSKLKRRRKSPHNGYWRITELGSDFVHRRVSIPKYVYLYDGFIVDGPDKTENVGMIPIVDALEKKFD